MDVSPESCAQELLDVAPLIMQAIRNEMRRRRLPDLTVPQFRTLLFIHHHPETSLSKVADHIGLTLPTMSKMVDGLVARRLVVRTPSPDDRRRIKLSLTSDGQVKFEVARKGAQERLADTLAALPESDRDLVFRAMQALRPVFNPVDPA